MSTARTAMAVAAERRIGRTLIAVTYVAVGLLVIGVTLMVADGISPLAGGPRLDPGALGADLAAFEPAGFLWLGLLVVIAAPIGQVVMAAIAYARAADWLMLWITVGIAATIALGIVTALAATV